MANPYAYNLGLGDYSKIVSVWVSHIEKKVADNDAMYDPDAEEE